MALKALGIDPKARVTPWCPCPLAPHPWSPPTPLQTSRGTSTPLGISPPTVLLGPSSVKLVQFSVNQRCSPDPDVGAQPLGKSELSDSGPPATEKLTQQQHNWPDCESSSRSTRRWASGQSPFCKESQHGVRNSPAGFLTKDLVFSSENGESG